MQPRFVSLFNTIVKGKWVIDDVHD